MIKQETIITKKQISIQPDNILLIKDNLIETRKIVSSFSTTI